MHGHWGQICVLLVIISALLLWRLLIENFGAVWTNSAMMAKFASLAELHWAHRAWERFFARVRILVLLLVLGKAERFRTEATPQILLGIMLVVMPLEREVSCKDCFATKNVTFKNTRTFLLSSSFFHRTGGASS